jgi:hypothetical protein
MKCSVDLSTSPCYLIVFQDIWEKKKMPIFFAFVLAHVKGNG